jgi:hypothetical protein
VSAHDIDGFLDATPARHHLFRDNEFLVRRDLEFASQKRPPAFSAAKMCRFR